MKAFLKLVKSFCDFFKPKPKKYYSRDGIIIKEFFGTDPYSYSVGHGGSGGSDGKKVITNTEKPAEEDFKDGFGSAATDPVTAYTHLAAANEFSKLIDPFYNDKIVDVGSKTKNKKLTKKQQIVKLNTSDILEILKWKPILTAIQLQKASRIRRDRFLPLLKKLVKQGKIERTGTGKRGNPYFYSLSRNIK